MFTQCSILLPSSCSLGTSLTLPSPNLASGLLGRTPTDLSSCNESQVVSPDVAERRRCRPPPPPWAWLQCPAHSVPSSSSHLAVGPFFWSIYTVGFEADDTRRTEASCLVAMVQVVLVKGSGDARVTEGRQDMVTAVNTELWGSSACDGKRLAARAEFHLHLYPHLCHQLILHSGWRLICLGV